MPEQVVHFPGDALAFLKPGPRLGESTSPLQVMVALPKGPHQPLPLPDQYAAQRRHDEEEQSGPDCLRQQHREGEPGS
ncbi:hypothetical protein IHE61_10480 [Streptomyces sp. GKU 257-1]|nr:hypothetical protein [Streptomyces sp. GKU 257-1]